MLELIKEMMAKVLCPLGIHPSRIHRVISRRGIWIDREEYVCTWCGDKREYKHFKN